MAKDTDNRNPMMYVAEAWAIIKRDNPNITDPSVRIRAAIELAIATRLIDDMLAAGYSVAIDNGGETYEYWGRDRAKLLKFIMATDDEKLYFYTPGADEHSYMGWVHLVYGNSGYDVISNYTSNPATEALVKSAMELADQLG